MTKVVCRGHGRPGARGTTPGTQALGRVAATHIRGRSARVSPLRPTDAHSRVHHRTTDHRPHPRPPATQRANSPSATRSAQTLEVHRHHRLGLGPRCHTARSPLGDRWGARVCHSPFRSPLPPQHYGANPVPTGRSRRQEDVAKLDRGTGRAHFHRTYLRWVD